MAELKNLKKGDTVILHMFTGIAVGVKEVLAADKETVTLETIVGKAKFSKKTGIQIEPEAKAPRFSNYITEDDGSFVPRKKTKKTEEKAEKPAKGKKKSENSEKITKKSTKKAKQPDPEPEDDEDYEEV